MAYFSSDYLQFFKELAGNNNMQWYYHTDFSPQVILEDNLMDVILDLWKKGQPVKNFLSQAILN